MKNQIEQEGIETLKNTEFVDNFGKHGMRTVKMINGEKQEFVTNTYHNRALMFIEQILDYNSMYNLNQYDWVWLNDSINRWTRTSSSRCCRFLL